MDIVIWDSDNGRIVEIDRNLRLAMKQLGIKGRVTSMSEPPLLGRMGLLGKVPVLEINGCWWSLPQGTTIDLEQCLDLFARLRAGGVGI